MPLSPSRAAGDRGVMDLVVMDLVVAVLAAAVLAAAVAPRPGGIRAGRVRHAAVRRWQAHVHLWGTVLSRDPWAPRPAAGHDAGPLRWEGLVLRGTDLPGRPR
jgi:hypothetical protein